VSFFGDEIEEIVEFDPLTGKKAASLDYVRVFANSHYVTPGPTMKQAMEAIRFELTDGSRSWSAAASCSRRSGSSSAPISTWR
jgi:excinuclease UvrABC helicase subunit UvrB